MNTVSLILNAGSDTEVKYTPKGTAVAEIRGAHNYVYSVDGDKREKTSWFTIKLFGRAAEIAGEYVTKGKRVGITGRLEEETWDDKQTGQKRSKVVVVAEHLDLLDGGKDKNDKVS